MLPCDPGLDGGNQVPLDRIVFRDSGIGLTGLQPSFDNDHVCFGQFGRPISLASCAESPTLLPWFIFKREQQLPIPDSAVRRHMTNLTQRHQIRLPIRLAMVRKVTELHTMMNLKHLTPSFEMIGLSH
jgi:hypothetical protein